MKTVLDLPEDLLERARHHAASANTTLEAMAEEGLRRLLDRTTPTPSNARITPVITHGQGLAPHLPSNFVANLRDFAYDDESHNP